MGSYQSGSNAKFPRSLAFLCIEELARYADEWWERPDYEAIIDALTAEQKGPLLCMVASEHTDAMRKNEKLSAVLASGANESARLPLGISSDGGQPHYPTDNCSMDY